MKNNKQKKFQLPKSLLDMKVDCIFMKFIFVLFMKTLQFFLIYVIINLFQFMKKTKEKEEKRKEDSDRQTMFSDQITNEMLIGR